MQGDVKVEPEKIIERLESINAYYKLIR